MNEAEFRKSEADRAELADLSDRFEASVVRAAGAGRVLDGAFVTHLLRLADHAHDNESYRTLVSETVLRDAAEIIRDEKARVARLMQALRVASHEPHDQLGEPNEGFPVCSVCGAIQTDRAPASGEPARVMAPGDYDIGANGAIIPAAPEEGDDEYPFVAGVPFDWKDDAPPAAGAEEPR